MSDTEIVIEADRRYPVIVGSGLVDRLPAMVGGRASQVLVVHASALTEVATRIDTVLSTAGMGVTRYELPDGEAGKSLGVIAGAWDVLGADAFGREDAIVAVGGGAVTDAAGFIAATWLRGVPVVHVPSTLLAMVDAAVGGKTGINTAAGKNLVGAFHSPAAVLCDLDLLRTLPRADLRAGMAEVVKCGFIEDEEILTLVEADPDAALEPTGAVLRELIERAIAVKAGVVATDLREASLREVLNYGHTMAHAIENVQGYTWRHGDAVAVGMVYAAELARHTGHLDADAVARHRQVLDLLGLPTTYRSGQWEVLLQAMRRDKKTRAGTLRFVVLDAIGRPVRLVGPDDEALRAAYRAISDPAPEGP